MKKFPRFILRMFGWRIDERTPEGIKKCVIVVGPHTSNWDFIIGKLAFSAYGFKTKFLIKKEAFVPVFGFFLKRMGGIPVDRSGKNNLTNTAVRYFNENESMYLVFTPEGTRSYNPNWKKGFFYIAQKAEVPIVVAYIDYAKKCGGFKEVMSAQADVDEGIEYIKSLLTEHKGKYPDKGIY